MLSPVTVEVGMLLPLGRISCRPCCPRRSRPSTRRAFPKEAGNMVVQDGNPACPRRDGPALRVPTPQCDPGPAAEKAGKAAGVKRRKVPASRKPPYSTSDFTPPPARSGGSNNATTEFMNMLDMNAVDIDQASFEPFNYNETDGSVDDHGAADELEEIEAEAFEQSQAKSGKSQRSKNYTILEDQALIQAWRLHAHFGHFKCVGRISNLCAACLEQVRNAPPSGTVESDYDEIAQQRYKDMKASEGKFLKLGHCWELLQKCEKWKFIDKESPPKRDSLINMDEDEDDDGPRNLHKPDGDKKTKEKMKREQEVASLREKIDAMVQSNELMLLKSLEIKKELSEKKAKEKLEKWQMLKEEGLRKAAIEERKVRASETKSMSLLLVEENKIMSMNRDDMNDLTKT
ncbi:Lactation elevated protein 1 [Hordeum vulgare]|nr:Lactation elevated protein 1 [Hordeum vulgare]